MKIQKSIILCIAVAFFTCGFTSFYTEFEERLAQLRKSKKVVSLISKSDRKRSNETKSNEVELGEMLFNDKRLSKNKNVSCASCHMADKGFSNGIAMATGTNGDTLTRHVPHLYNLDFNIAFFWDGRVTNLEEQLKVVLKSKTEMDMTFKELRARLNDDETLKAKFLEVYPKKGITQSTITKSMVAYEKSIVATDSKYDLFLEGNSDALSEREQRGLALFIGQANCIACHNGPNLTDNTFHNVGIKTNDVGRQAIDKIGMNKEFESTPYPFFSTFKAFKTPSLRNVNATAPYFHDGSKKSLEEVVAFYNSGGENPNRSGLAKEIVPLNLSDEQQGELIFFLKALSSENSN